MAMKIVLSGMVQGVFCRDYCAQYARKLQIRGSATNVPDGSVQVLLDTDNMDLINEFVHCIKTNPYSYRFYGKIDEVQLSEYSGPLYGDCTF